MPIHPATGRNLETLCIVRVQLQKVSFIGIVQHVQIHRDEKQIGNCQGLGGLEEWGRELLLNGYKARFPFGC